MKIENLNFRLNEEKEGYKVKCYAAVSESGLITSVSQGTVETMEDGTNKTVATFYTDMSDSARGNSVSYSFKLASVSVQKAVIDIVSSVLDEIYSHVWSLNKSVKGV